MYKSNSTETNPFKLSEAVQIISVFSDIFSGIPSVFVLNALNPGQFSFVLLLGVVAVLSTK